MNVWALFPSAHPEKAREAAQRWKKRGYKIGLFLEASYVVPDAEFKIVDEYPGYWSAANRLAKYTMSEYKADIVVLIGDDMDPDPNFNAQEIGAQYLKRFPDGFGVMQPCGDMQGMDSKGVQASARICGSGWYGRGWVERSYQGNGPTCGDYHHYYSDEEVKVVAERLGVLWLRSDLIQDHHHWSYGRSKMEKYHERNQDFWYRDKALFEERALAGFPGSEPL